MVSGLLFVDDGVVDDVSDVEGADGADGAVGAVGAVGVVAVVAVAGAVEELDDAVDDDDDDDFASAASSSRFLFKVFSFSAIVGSTAKRPPFDSGSSPSVKNCTDVSLPPARSLNLAGAFKSIIH